MLWCCLVQIYLEFTLCFIYFFILWYLLSGGMVFLLILLAGIISQNIMMPNIAHGLLRIHSVKVSNIIPQW